MRKMSEKKRASLGNKPVYSTITAKPKKRKSWKRKPSEFKRIYGSKARVEFVKSLPCAACGYSGRPSENAHVVGNGGTGRKADYTTISPLCGPHPVITVPTWEMRNHIGDHRYFDEKRSAFDADFPDFNPEQAAADCESAWLLHIGEAHQK